MFENKQKLILAVMALVPVAIWLSVAFQGEPPLTVTFLDVGDGLCAVVRSPSGATLVMDCGTATWRKSETIGEKLVAPYLQSMGVDTIDVAVLSHPHADHVSGYAGLLRLKPARLVLDIGARHGSPYYRRFLEVVRESGANYRIAKRGQSIDLGGGVVAHVLNPDPAKEYTDLNNNSIVLRIVYKNASFLLAADAGAEAERDILASCDKLRSQVLQVGHHGSDQSSTPEWLYAVRPGLAVISCARRSRYGHPSQEVIDRLNSLRSRVYTTGKHGAVTITTDGDTVSVRTHRKSR